MVTCLSRELTEKRSAVLWTMEMVGEGTPVALGQLDTLKIRKVTVTKLFVLIRYSVVVPQNRISEVWSRDKNNANLSR